MNPLMPARKWQSFYELVMRTKKPHYIYRNGEWFGFCCDNNIILDHGLSTDDLPLIAAYGDGNVEPKPPKPPKPPATRLVCGDNIGILVMPIVLVVIGLFFTLLLGRI